MIKCDLSTQMVSRFSSTNSTCHTNPQMQMLAYFRTPCLGVHLAGSQESAARERMGRAELVGGNMSTQDPSELWERSDGGEELLQDLGWYHGNLSRHAAEALLLSNGRDGSYLLRDSNEQTGLYSLSVRAKDSVKHFHVEYTGYSFKFGFNEYSTLKDFVKHFANQPLIGSETAAHKNTAVTLFSDEEIKTGVLSCWRLSADTGIQAKHHKEQLGTKEGYLTKQGGLVKSPEPIRILDLTECSAVQFDYSQERVNCFCLVFPFRTFYLCAKTGVEADEWIKILRWKLVSYKSHRMSSLDREHVDDFGEL
ncbi:dual adapter for phosphotyrosine and 3-phosphotyrosine and 3-phosphoinositide-like protein [Cricetulus griseus]|nr:dual adapter for phosphotyrosine and 3-phosphotyrosine and 3-phosphoinositide-like protein [Cricetulus griseus]